MYCSTLRRQNLVVSLAILHCAKHSHGYIPCFAEAARFADTTAGTFPPRYARTEKSFEPRPHVKQFMCSASQFFSLRSKTAVFVGQSSKLFRAKSK